MDGEGMAGMMSGEGEMSDMSGAPNGMDMTADYTAEFGEDIPDSGPPNGSMGTDQYFSGGGAGMADPASGENAPGEFADTSGDYLKEFEAGGGPALFDPNDYDVFGNYIGKGAGAKPAAPGPKPFGPEAGEKTAPDRESVLRNKNSKPRPVANPFAADPPPAAAPQPAAEAKPATGGQSAPANLGPQYIFHLKNQVSNFDGTGFSIGFSVDYSLQLAPEEGATFVWMVTFEELNKEGRGSSMRKVQQAFKPSDSGTLKMVVKLKGKPKEPYRCGIGMRKNGKTTQVSRIVIFPPAPL
jgi:hypothetical protein